MVIRYVPELIVGPIFVVFILKGLLQIIPYTLQKSVVKKFCKADRQVWIGQLFCFGPFY
jgi:hypothetical protein